MNQTTVLSLIHCDKIIRTKPRKTMTADQRNAYTLRNDFTCVSEDGKVFEVFMRLNTKFPFVFSIGLRYRSENGDFILCRYNGKHQHKNKIGDNSSFDAFHIHRLYDEQLSDETDSSLDAEPTTEYATFDEALYLFLTDCHIKGWEKFFPRLEDDISQFRIGGF